MKVRGYRPGNVGGAGGAGKIHYIAPEFRAGTTHMGKVTSNFGAIGKSQGVFVDFGGEECRAFTGVIWGKEAASLQKGDEIFVTIHKEYFDEKQDKWKFELMLDADAANRFPISRQGYIVVPKDKIDSDLDGVVLEQFGDYVQSKDQVLEFCDPPAIIKINGQEHELLAPEGYLAVLDEMMGRQPFEMIAIGSKRSSDFYFNIKLAHPKFPDIELGWVEIKVNNPVRVKTGDRVMCVADYVITNKARFFEHVMTGCQGYKFLSASPPPLSELAEKTGMPEALCAFVKGLQPHNVVELILVGKPRESCVPRHPNWSLAHPDFPDKPIGFAGITDWQMLEQGDKALFSPPSSERDILASAAEGMICFRYVPKKLAPGTVVLAKVLPADDNIFAPDREALVSIKNCNRAVVPCCLLIGHKAGDQLMVHIFDNAILGNHIAMPEDRLEDLLALQAEMLTGIEAEIISEYQQLEDHGIATTWVFQGYKVRVTFRNMQFQGYLPSEQPIEGLAIGQKAIIKEGQWPYRDPMAVIFGMLKYNIKFEFVGAV